LPPADRTDSAPDQSRLLALAADVGRALTTSRTLAGMLRVCAEAMVAHLDSAFARVWTLDEAAGVLVLWASAGMYTHLDGPHGRVPVGQYKIGLIAQERTPHLTNAVVGDPRVSDQEWAVREGMVTFAGYPLVVEDLLVGVTALFARHVLSDLTLQALGSVADQIAVGIDRVRSEEALRQSEARYRAVFEVLAEGITVQDATGLWQEANSSAERILTLSREQMAGRTSADPRWGTVYEDGALLPGEAHPLMVALRTGQPVRDMLMGIHRPDGTFAWLSANAELIVAPETGEATGVVTSFFDITTQRQAEAMRVAAKAQQRTLLRDVLASVTEGKLLLPNSPAHLPAPLKPVGGPIPLTREGGPRALRLRAREAAQDAGHSEERRYDLLTAVREAGMNAIVHGGGGTGRVSFGKDGTVQVRVEDHGKGIAMENLPRATLSRGFTTAGTLGHGLKLMLETADRLSLLTGPGGTTLVLEQERERPLPSWM
jgi:PAS domain S-box-containing protein